MINVICNEQIAFYEVVLSPRKLGARLNSRRDQ